MFFELLGRVFSGGEIRPAAIRREAFAERLMDEWTSSTERCDREKDKGY